MNRSYGIPMVSPELQARYAASSDADWFRADETAAILNLPVHLVGRLARQGALRRVTIQPRTFRYTKAAIEAYRAHVDEEQRVLY